MACCCSAPVQVRPNSERVLVDNLPVSTGNGLQRGLRSRARAFLHGRIRFSNGRARSVCSSKSTPMFVETPDVDCGDVA